MAEELTNSNIRRRGRRRGNGYHSKEIAQLAKTKIGLKLQ